MGVEDDRFPVGLRVLVVDDDPTCLRLMHTLLLKCDYHVTTTNQAMEALKMLRQNDNKFDIVISDVHMPDMDGFRLLELVGIEMDLPVIMLSAYGDAQLVMKGIRHGACDYLLKPVRIQELKNIWQHVVRRIKCTHQGKESCRAGDGEKGSAHDSGEEQEQDEELRRKRTDQNSDEDDEEIEGKGCENDEDTSSWKKPRVAWSAELHRKFVAAVDQLGLDRAFPKKILDLMNVEGLTRENVASHLQKYRQGLKRINSQATQLENSAAALGGKDSYMYMGSLQGQDGVIRSLVGPGRFLRSNASLSYQPGRMLGQLNTASGLSLRALSSSSLLQGCQAQNSNNSFKALAKIRPLGLPSNQNASLFQGIPTTLELDHLQMQQNKYSLLGPSGTYLASIGNLQKMGMKFGTLGDQTVLNVVSSDADPLREPIGTCSSLVDYNKCEKYWGRDVQPVVAPNHFDESNDGTDPLDLFCGISSLEASTGTNQRCQDPEQDNILNSNNMFSTPSSLGPVVPRLNDLDQSNGISGVQSLRLLENATSTLIQQGEVQKPNNNQKVRIDDDYVLEDTGFLNSFAHNSCESLEDMVAGFIKQGNGDSTSLCDELGLDVFPI